MREKKIGYPLCRKPSNIERALNFLKNTNRSSLKIKNFRRPLIHSNVIRPLIHSIYLMSEETNTPKNFYYSAPGEEEVEWTVYPSVFNQVLKQMGFQNLTLEKIMSRYEVYSPTVDPHNFRIMTVNDLAVFNLVFDYKKATDVESCRMEIIRFIRSFKRFNTHYPQRTFELIQLELQRFREENNIPTDLQLKINWLPQYGGRIRQATNPNDDYGTELNQLNELDEDLFFDN